MKENLILLKRQKSYPVNNIPLNRYMSTENDYEKKISNTQNNNILSDDYNNYYRNKNRKINSNIHIFQSINNRYNNKFNLDINESSKLKRQNISLLNSIKFFEKKLKMKDMEINGYKQKMKALLKQIKEKNSAIYKKNNLIIKLYDEQEYDNTNDILRISNYKLKNKNNQLITERKKLINCISKIQNDYNKIREDSLDKDNQIKSLLNFFTRKNKSTNSRNINNNNIINILNNIDNQIEYEKYNFEIQIISKNKKNKNVDVQHAQRVQRDDNYKISKNNFMIKNILFSNKKKNDYNELMNSYKELENQKKQLEQLLSLKEKVINNSDKEINELKNKINECNIKYINHDKLLQNKETTLKNLENENNILKNDLIKEKEEKNNIKKQYDVLLNNFNKNNNDDNIKLLNDIILSKDKEITSHKNNISKLEEKIKGINEKNHKDMIILDENNKKIINSKNEINKKLKEDIDKLNNELKRMDNLRIEDKNKINELYNNVEKLQKENQELFEKNKSIQEIKNINVNHHHGNDDYDEIKKENEKLNKTNSQLNQYITELNEKLNSLNIKYQENKKSLTEKESKINNLEQASLALIEKQKRDLEQKDKNEHISPGTHFIITSKKYNKLTWYLMSNFNPNDERVENEKKANYKNYKWVTELIIPKSKLNKYNKFIDNEDNINNNSYIKKLYRQLEQKEEEVNKLNYKNKKLNEKIQNKSSSVQKGKLYFNKFLENTDKSNTNRNIINTENTQAQNNSLVDKVINYYETREINYKNEITKLKTDKKKSEDFQTNINNIKCISLQSKSDFIDFDDTDGDIVKYLGDKNILKKNEKKNDDEEILKDIPGNESDLDEVKGLKTLTKFLKNDNKEKDKKFNKLVDKIKNLIQSLKYDNNLKVQISQVLELLGYSSADIQKIISNNKGYILHS